MAEYITLLSFSVSSVACTARMWATLRVCCRRCVALKVALQCGSGPAESTNVVVATFGICMHAKRDDQHAGKFVADTAAAAGVKVFVFSTLENVEKRTEARSLTRRPQLEAQL